ncbi:CBS domain-containing protein [Sulfitobacter pseudonitzschiae]|uniref:CBS domain-containing protein n=1 Tax=Pseudosulfitobacter pseudonitzschiae TaxID=1402135 RepID=A0A9Q2NFZ3_9RHOB|nr:MULTISPECIES: CBS domain-containing protein [Roseobacteraceae]MBM2291161.1 CBS domain-containing protein [Pseudosulfitobacter pseudonitzschiae]MBM2296079.1 CBS domain-containing protein [Pseudosulfitobacter pseudonitzschiae]MBM2300992.1 CBS domain-containing protein [Pseudosulfitobacter pseudonitzschiae]MBM2310776.1 CBS domain-containing protein [Pseudosulfitobacter pseudonitzschiae]MBM2315689.1 CBS domain-containing protein [Pseudosulfitobacter pseudonitzschiae]|tara:strand:- start:1651 stop:2085 length:435 start_codon:yes stop_codon:yes gene_type:complete
MLVQQILQSKSSDAVITVKPGTSVSDAAKILAKHKFGSVVVSRDGATADGILSERDIVRELATRGASCLQDPVEAYMTTKLVTCTRQDSVESVLQHMSDGRFRHMPVVEEGKLVGLITQGDVVKARLSKVSMEKEALQGMIMGH